MNEYSTRDLWVAAVLLTKGLELKRIEWRSSTTAYFVYPAPEACIKVVIEFWKGTLIVPAKDYAHSLKDLKFKLFRDRHRTIK